MFVCGMTNKAGRDGLRHSGVEYLRQVFRDVMRRNEKPNVSRWSQVRCSNESFHGLGCEHRKGVAENDVIVLATSGKGYADVTDCGPA